MAGGCPGLEELGTTSPEAARTSPLGAVPRSGRAAHLLTRKLVTAGPLKANTAAMEARLVGMEEPLVTASLATRRRVALATILSSSHRRTTALVTPNTTRASTTTHNDTNLFGLCPPLTQFLARPLQNRLPPFFHRLTSSRLPNHFRLFTCLQ